MTMRMKPGKPLMFGLLNGTGVLGLPGNPVSSMVCALLFLGPALDKMLGLPGDGVAIIRAKLGADVAANNFREDYMRGSLRGAAPHEFRTSVSYAGKCS